MLKIWSSYIWCLLCQAMALLGVTASWVIILVKFTVLDWLGFSCEAHKRCEAKVKTEVFFLLVQDLFAGTIAISVWLSFSVFLFSFNLMNCHDHHVKKTRVATVFARSMRLRFHLVFRVYFSFWDCV